MRVVRIDQGHCRIEGDVSYDTARAAHAVTRAELATILEESPEAVEVDLSGITAGNSLVLSLMLAWMRQARQHERRLRYCAVPAQVLELIQFTGLDDVLPLAGEPAA